MRLVKETPTYSDIKLIKVNTEQIIIVHLNNNKIITYSYNNFIHHK